MHTQVIKNYQEKIIKIEGGGIKCGRVGSMVIFFEFFL